MGYIRGTLAGGTAALALNAERRVSTRTSFFGTAHVGTSWVSGGPRELDYSAVGGVRFRF